MKQKVLKLCKAVYSWGMTAAFLAGGLPVFPILLAMFLGKPCGEAITVFFFNKYYPCVFLTASVCMLAGLLVTYMEKGKNKTEK